MPHGFVNVHFSLLPRWRGAAPVERAMLAGDAETGVCIMGLEAGLDTGPVYARSACAIGAHETAGELRARLVTAGTELLVATLPAVPHDHTGPAARASPPTPTSSRSRSSRSTGSWPPTTSPGSCAPGNPRPGAWTTDHGGRLKIWRARALSAGIDAPPGTVFGHTRVATGDGALELIEVQPEGRRAMPRERVAGRPAGAAPPCSVREAPGVTDTSPRASSRSTRSSASKTAPTRT